VPSAAFISGDFTLREDGPPMPNGCAWMRLVLPSREVQKHGWDTGVGLPRVHPEQGIGIAHEEGVYLGWDVSVFKLMMNQSIASLFRLMQEQGKRVIVDVDDAHFALHEENVAHHSTNPHASPDSNRMYYEVGIRQADTVTVATEFLLDHYERRCRDVRLIRNGLDVDRFTPVEQGEKPTLGWVGATYWRSGDLEVLRDWLPGFVKDHGVEVWHAGHIPNDTRHFGVRTGLGRVKTMPMATIDQYPLLFQPIRIGLVPLNLCDFSEAKSYLKGLEYAASGIPFVASPTHEYRLLASEGIGRIASTPDEWRDHVTELLDPDVRRAEAEKQRALVSARYHIETKGEAWSSVLAG
jgi:glycosyltransferase involved in cell wall biosynthesis